MGNNILLGTINYLGSCSTGTLFLGSVIGLWVLLAGKFPLFPEGREIFKDEHAHGGDKYSWRPRPYWRLEGSGTVTDFETCFFYTSSSVGWGGGRTFRSWDRVKNRHLWTQDRRSDSPTCGLSALSTEVSANFSAVLAGNPNPPPINWTVRFTGL
jgi:hypothetical protein